MRFVINYKFHEVPMWRIHVDTNQYLRRQQRRPVKGRDTIYWKFMIILDNGDILDLLV